MATPNFNFCSKLRARPHSGSKAGTNRGARTARFARAGVSLSIRAGVCVALLTGLALPSLTAAPRPGGAAGAETAPVALAENALTRMAKADYGGAAQQTIRALKAAPDDADLHILAGALLLHTGDNARASVAFQNALSCDPSDALARYGLALTQLGSGNRDGAQNTLKRAEQNGGDPSYILMARRYAQWLDGAQVSLNNAGFPDAFAPAQRALAGMNALRRGDMQQASIDLGAAQDALPGDLILEPSGALMTFDPPRPLAAGSPSLPPALAQSLSAPLPAQKGMGGVVQITPQDVSASVAYVGFELDGKSQGMVNTRPFGLNLDTRTLANGWHTLVIVTYDNEAVEMGRVTRRLRTFNAHSDGGPLADNVLHLRAGLWESLTLRPDRFACAFGMGLAQQRAGDAAGARLWFLRACALRPENGASRHALAALGGVGQGGEAMYGGLNDEKVVALTFDDGPKPGVTEPLLDLLTSLRVPATFFVIGRHVIEYPELTRQIDAAGMEIANHSYTHRNLTKISSGDVARETMQTQAAVQLVTGKTPRYLRPPGGNWNGSVADIVRSWGLTPCMWTVDVYGSEVIGAQQVADAVLAQVRPGSVVLMHNGKLSTLQALPTIIRELKKRGYAFATVDALAQRLSASRAAARQAALVYAARRHAE